MHQARIFFAGLSLRQRLLLVGGAVLVGATLYVFVQLIGKPEYKTLYSGNDPAGHSGNCRRALTAQEDSLSSSPRMAPTFWCPPTSWTVPGWR